MQSRIALASAGVSIVLTTAERQLPSILHWGAALDVDDAAVEQLLLAREWMVVPNSPEDTLVEGVLLEARFGWMGKPGLIGSRHGLDWTPAWQLDEVLLDGRPVGPNLVCGGAGIVEYRASAAGLRLRLWVELLGCGLIRTSAEITNLAAEPFEVAELTLALPVPSVAREVLDFAGRWGGERYPQRRLLETGAHRRENRHGRTGADSAYVLSLGEPGFGYQDGEIWAVHTAWSGNHIHYAEREYLGAQVIGGGELLLAGETVLAQDQSYTTPWVFGNYAVGLDNQAARFHEYLRGLPSHPAGPPAVTLNVWEAVYFDHDIPRLLDLADRAAGLGVDRFVLDDGWFLGRRDDTAGLGDWVVDPAVWPEGLHPLANRVTELGMQFGLWFEPEMVNPDSNLAREHPDWLLQPAGRLPIESRTQQVLNLTIPATFEHVLTQVDAVLSEYPISYVKWDHNRDLIDAGTAPAGRPAVSKQTAAFYRLLDALRANHPKVEFESCSSGGARIDLEVLQRVQRVWVSDNIDSQDRQRMLWWTGQLLPMELMGSHVASGRSHTTSRWHDLNFRAATAVFGHLGIEWDLAQASPDEIAQLSGWIEWYKANRDVIATGRLVRIAMPEPGVYFKGVVGDRKAIYSLSMELPTNSANLGRLRFLGLEKDRRYRVTIIDKQLVPPLHRVPWERRSADLVLTGAQLGQVGLRAPQLQPATAVLFEFEVLQ